ncbi:MAG TPA: hypothetical protein VHI51_00230, partial [Ktedonobacterales bacterium]|nr:hypothetical protein [Ktedonobacterales bacterium]
GYTYTSVPINWYNRATGVSKLKIKEMGSRYLFIVLYVWLEQLLARGDYRRKLVASGATRTALPPQVEEQAEAEVMHATLPRISAPQPLSGAATALAVAEPDAQPATPLRAVAPPREVEQTPTPTRASDIPNWAIMLIVAVVAWALILSRRPDAIFNAQFWAEDGIWYSQAYNLGALPALLIPNVGYLNLIPRLVAGFSLLFPMLYAPLIFNIIAVVAQSSPVIFLFSRRFDGLIPNRAARVALAFLYIALPNSFEVNATITNTQWHLAVLTFMIVIAAVPRSIAGKAFDIIVILLSGLSGPFCVALIPILALRWLMDRRGHTITLFVVNAIAVGVQGFTYLTTTPLDRAKSPLGASPLEFARLVAGQLFVGASLGMNQYARIMGKSWWASNKLVVAITVVGLAIFAFALWKGSNGLRLFVLYAWLIYGLGLISPLAIGPIPAWVQMTSPGASVRYEYLPMVAFVTVLVWLLSRRRALVARSVGALALIVMLLVGVPSDWQYPPYINLHYSSYVQQFDAAPAGTDVTFPTNPNWSMTLHKH